MFSFVGAMDFDGPPVGSSSGAAAPNAAGLAGRIRELEEQIQRMQLLNQALWEALSAKTGLTEAEFLAKVKEVDMRDGQEDGKMGTQALKCPKCQRVSSSKHWRCLYCSAKFKRPTMA